MNNLFVILFLTIFSACNKASFDILRSQSVGDTPAITSVSAVNSGMHIKDDVFSVKIRFDQNVDVTGTPLLDATLTSGSVVLSYQSGSGTNELIFSHTVLGSNLDLNGPDLTFPLRLNGGTIVSSSTLKEATLSYADSNLASIDIDGRDLVVSSISYPANATYTTGAVLEVSLNLSHPIAVVGTPFIPVTIGGITRNFSYSGLSTSTLLRFRYTVQSNETDSDGIDVDFPIDVNGGTLLSTQGRDVVLPTISVNRPAVLIDSVPATISSISHPVAATYYEGQNLDFTVNYSHAITVTGTPRIELTVGSTSRFATYVSGSTTTALLFRYTVVSGELDTNGVGLVTPILLNGGTMVSTNRSVNLTFTNQNFATVLVDSIPATIASITGPTAGTYSSGQNLDFTVNYTYAITVTGNPQIELTVGSTARSITYVSGSGSTALLFRYTVAPADFDGDGLSLVSPVLLSGGTMTSTNRSVGLTFTNQNFATVLVSSNSAPVFANFGNQVFIRGYEQEFFVPFEDVDFGNDHTFSATGLTGSGVVLDTATGNFTIPAAAVAGDYSVNLTIDDGQGGTDSVAFTLSIAASGGTFSKNSLTTGVRSDAVLNTGDEFTGWWYVPTAYAAYPSANFCVIVNFHGQGENGTGSSTDLDRLGTNYPAAGSATESGLVRQVNTHSRTYPCLVFVPQADTLNWIYGHVIAVMREALRKYPRIDRNRIYVMGLSIGGGIQNFLASQASHFATAFIPAGADMRLPSDPSYVPTADELVNSLFPSMWSIVGGDDFRLQHNLDYKNGIWSAASNSPNVEADYVSATAPTIAHASFNPLLNNWGLWTNAVGDLESNFRLSIYKGQGHTNTVMLYPYGNTEMLTWLFKKNKDSGIRASELEFSTPFSPNTAPNAVTLSGKFRDVNGSISKIYANLQTLSGGNWVEMSHTGNGVYSLNYTVPSGLPVGAKRVTIMAFDNDGNHKPYILTHQVGGAIIGTGVFDTILLNFKPSDNTTGCNEAGESPIDPATQLDTGYVINYYYGKHINKPINFVTLGSNTGIIMHYIHQTGFTATRAGPGVAYPHVVFNQQSNLGGGYTAPATAALSRCGILFRRGTLNTPALGYDGLKLRFHGFNPGFTYRVHIISSLYADPFANGMSASRSDSVNLRVNTQTLTGQNIWQRRAPFTFNNVALNEDLSIEVELDMPQSKDLMLNAIIFEPSL